MLAMVECLVSGFQGAGVLEGFKLFWKYDYIKGIFAMSCLFMVEVTILDYTMKVTYNLLLFVY